MHVKIAGAIACAAAAVVAVAGLSGSYVVPLEHEAIQYAKLPVTDPVARLEKRMAAGEVKLAYDEDTGFLESVLKQLQVSVESQVLVFSKTSFQAPRIAPRMPRALYFNDSVSVGFVRAGDVLEFAAVDPKQGVIFYTLDQDSSAKPHFERRDTCLQCHASGATLGVPGLVVRSVYPERSGMPMFQAGSFVTDHRSPLKERWGGWYVTGSHGSQVHMGNAVVPDRDHPDKLEAEGTQNLSNLDTKIDTGRYLSPHSDIVALMVLEHQTYMTNLITRVSYETRMALHSQAAINTALGTAADEMSESTKRRINSAVEELVQYMLFIDETPLTGPIKGTSDFAKEFAASGPLREFDLTKRLFKLPCSYMIYSEAFDSMPAPARERIYRRLYEVLTGADSTAKYRALSPSDRKSVFDTLRKTKKDLPVYWQGT
jgi:hypothetical protein